MNIKKGVYGYAHVALLPVIAEYEWWRRSNGYAEGTITGLMDGEHSDRSWHYEGRAVDFRTRDMEEKDILKLVEWFMTTLSNDYDVVVHSTHIHVEYEGRWSV